jgi:DNA-binding IclR family transcriptional regulator
MSSEKSKRTSGIDRVLQILDLLTESQQPMTVYELAKLAGAPMSTFYKIVDDMLDKELLSKAGNKQVWLGPRLMRYGLLYRSKMDVFTVARKEMKRLSEELGETTQVCARDEGMMTVIGMSEAEGHFRVTSDVGTRVPLNWTASGRLLLGHLSQAERIAIFSKCAKPSDTGTAQTNVAELAEQSKQDFDNKLAVQLGSSEYAVACIASPIRDMNGDCLATISVVLAESKARENQSKYATAVQKAALTIERAMGR